MKVNRFFIHENIYDEFVKGFKQKVTELSLGFGLDQSPDMGPLISKNAQSRMTYFVNDAVAKGAMLLSGEVSQSLLIVAIGLVQRYLLM